MTKEEFLKSNTFKVLLVCIIAVSIIKIYQAGYVTGKWLYAITH
jgi:hypothetical protein